MENPSSQKSWKLLRDSLLLCFFAGPRGTAGASRGPPSLQGPTFALEIQMQTDSSPTVVLQKT